MKSKIFYLLAFVLTCSYGYSQLSSSEAHVTFYSKKEDITAKNAKGSSKLNVSSGEITFEVSILEFIFANSTMQKHFNQEGIMNSEVFPKATFVGKIVNNSEVDYTADGTYDVMVKGTMSIKGVSKDFEAKGKIIVKGGVISAAAVFSLDRFDYGVTGKEQSVSQVLELKVEVAYH